MILPCETCPKPFKCCIMPVAITSLDLLMLAQCGKPIELKWIGCVPHLDASDSKPCQFFDLTTRKCSIYNFRPLRCRAYPAIIDDYQDKLCLFAAPDCIVTSFEGDIKYITDSMEAIIHTMALELIEQRMFNYDVETQAKQVKDYYSKSKRDPITRRVCFMMPQDAFCRLILKNADMLMATMNPSHFKEAKRQHRLYHSIKPAPSSEATPLDKYNAQKESKRRLRK